MTSYFTNEHVFMSTEIQFQFTSDLIVITEGINTTVSICIEPLNAILQRNVLVVLQTQDGTAIGELVCTPSNSLMSLFMLA